MGYTLSISGRHWALTEFLRMTGREKVFVMQPTQDRLGMDGIRLSAAMARFGMRVGECERRIGNTRTQRHMGAPCIVVCNPQF